MNRLTSDQLARAVALIKASEAHERAIHIMGNLIEAAQLAVDANQRARDALTNFGANPDRLADAVPLMRRADAETKLLAKLRYESLLQDLISPALGGPPRKIDFNALDGGRPYLLAPYLGLVVAGVYPRLCFERSNPPNTLTYIVTSGAADPTIWRQHLPRISAWLGGNYQLTASTATTITLTRRPELPAVIPFNPAKLKRGHVYYGVDVDTQTDLHVPLSALTHTLTAGQSGSGKSVFLNQVLLSLLFNIDQLAGLTLVDLKGGVELGRYDGIDEKITVITEYEQLPDTVAGLVATMQDRLARLRASGQRAATRDFHVLVIDEYAAIQFRTFADKDAKQRHAKLLADLNLLAAQARAPGIKLWAQLQKPTADAMDTSFRTNLQSIVAFKIPNINASVIFDGLKDMPVKPSDLAKGRFILSLDGQPDRLVQSTLVPDDIDLARIVALGSLQASRGTP